MQFDLDPISSTLAMFGLPGGAEWIIILVIGVLIFGRRLPEVGKNLGRGIVEFKRGIKGIEDEVENESNRSGSDSTQRSNQANLGEQTRPGLPKNEGTPSGVPQQVGTGQDASA